MWISFRIERAPSTKNQLRRMGNKYAYTAWSNEWQSLARVSALFAGWHKGCLDEHCPVRFHVIGCYQAGKPMADSDGIEPKPILDGIKGWAMPDDDPRTILSTSTASVRLPKGEKSYTLVRAVWGPLMAPWEV